MMRSKNVMIGMNMVTKTQAIIFLETCLCLTNNEKTKTAK